MLWTAHKVIMQHRSEDHFQDWDITLPGHPVEVARTERRTDFTNEEARAYLGRIVGIDSGAVTKLYDQQENVLGFMYTVKGIPMGFLMKVMPEAKEQRAAKESV